MKDKNKVHPESGLVQTHVELAVGSFLTGTYRRDGWLGAFSEDIEDHFWNFLIPLNNEPKTNLNEIKDFFEKVDRSPTLWGEKEFIKQVKHSLELEGLDEKFVDSWMEFQGTMEEPDQSLEYVKVNSKEEKDSFVKIFSKAFGETDGDNPYGNLPQSYQDGIMRALNGVWSTHYDTSIIVKEGEKPVGIGTLAIKNDIAFIYNIGTVPEKQGEGIGTAATRKMVKLAKENNVDRIILQTESGSYVEDFYQDLGFETIFEMKGLTGL